MPNNVSKFQRVERPEPLECEWCAKLFSPKASNGKVRLNAKFCTKACQNQYQKHHKGFHPDSQ